MNVLSTTDWSPDRLAALPVVVIGAGPVGLAAAGHLHDRGLNLVVLEAGEGVGAAMSSWGHIRTFTPWQYIVDADRREAARAHRLDPAYRRGAADRRRGRRAGTYDPLGSGSPCRPGRRCGPHGCPSGRRDPGLGLDKARSLGREERPFLVRVERADGEQRGRARPRRHRRLRNLGQPQPAGRLRSPGTWGGRGGGRRLLGGPAARRPRPATAQRFAGRRHAGRRHGALGGQHAAQPCPVSPAEESGTRDHVGDPGGSDAHDACTAGAKPTSCPTRGRLGTDLRSLIASGAIELVAGSFAVDRGDHRRGSRDGHRSSGSTPAGELRIDAACTTVAAATGFRPDLAMLGRAAPRPRPRASRRRRRARRRSSTPPSTRAALSRRTATGTWPTRSSGSSSSA